MKFATKVIHAGIQPDPATGAIMTPIYQTSTYVQDAPGIHKGYAYARTSNPTRSALEDNLAALENGNMAICYSSGLAAMDAVLRLLQPGDHVISTNDLYGGSYRLMNDVLSNTGIVFDYVSMNTIDHIDAAVNGKTKMLWLETPTNPLLSIIDIQMICDYAKTKGIWVCVDNTFASPYLQNPLDLGADIVIHSATKYLGDHSDVIHGAVVVNDEQIGEKLKFIQKAVGAVPGPQDCFLVLRGIKTLHLRVQRSCDNARKIAEYLVQKDVVNKVYYPGLANHPNHHIAQKQMNDFGGMLSFDLKDDDMQKALYIMSNTKLFSLAESLGGVESLIGHPATMTHNSIPKEERLKIGLTDTLIRLSIGVEDVEDLVADLDRVL